MNFDQFQKETVHAPIFEKAMVTLKYLYDEQGMDESKFQKVSKLEEMNISDDYIIGWQEGYQHAPKLEEQRLTDAYEAGYEDGENNNIEKAENFKK